MARTKRVAPTASAVTKADLVRAVKAERGRTLSLLRPLTAEKWEIEAVPRWRVREVAAHLVTTDRASVTGGILPIVLGGTQESLERWNDRQVHKWADRPIGEILVDLERWGRRLLRLMRAVPAPAYRLPVPTQWGTGPAAMLAWGRAYDEWVHRQDVRLALGMELERADLASPVGFVLASIEVGVGPRVKVPGRVELDLRGVPLLPWSGLVGPSAPRDAARTVRIEADAAAFVMAVAGRGSFADLESRGEMEVHGDRDTADALFAVLRVV